MIIDNASIFS